MGVRFREALAHNQHLALTFDSEIAQARPILEFVTWQHILAKAAADFWNEERALEGGISAGRHLFEGPKEETGEAYYFIYALDELSANQRRTLEPVLVLDDGRVAEQTAKTLLVQLHNRLLAPQHLEHEENRFVEAQTRANAWISNKRDTIEDEARRKN